MQLTRRGLQLALGLLWLLDAALRSQSYFFSPAYATDTISPAGDGQPTFISAPVHTVAGWIATHPAIWNAAFIGVQVAIGLALLTRRFAPQALAASAVWGLSLWWLTEGVGGLFRGGANLLTGAPGATVLYAVLSLAAWPPVDRRRGRSDPNRLGPAGWLVYSWAALWVLGTVLQLWPDQRSGPQLASRVTAAGRTAPDWVRHLDTRVARSIVHTHLGVVVTLAALEALVGLAALSPGRLRAFSGWLGIVLAAAFWLLGQGLGGFTTHHASDPGTGPLTVVLGAAVLASGFASRYASGSRLRLGSTRSRRARSRAYGRRPAGWRRS